MRLLLDRVPRGPRQRHRQALPAPTRAGATGGHLGPALGAGHCARAGRPCRRRASPLTAGAASAGVRPDSLTLNAMELSAPGPSGESVESAARDLLSVISAGNPTRPVVIMNHRMFTYLSAMRTTTGHRAFPDLEKSAMILRSSSAPACRTCSWRRTAKASPLLMGAWRLTPRARPTCSRTPRRAPPARRACRCFRPI